ncbi:2-amino-4-hydroxy-6-hydroxymethyldihydropteridine diphosphokinase [Saprospira sp. CCB-QB6]|uniref:2-amino-4-hydroxy-6- hydroxymethyldihydropteridine diphosphokinase n=1 Tax=Saprospira sp. CCB-QB6 TaxID=3023936 RepID=UPI00234B2629|nr:2-amino-4-hydroxy-6-hydroxymethyldihydropteridine diphosphokinase [Saprospira sp. CCB-QB6]WCL80319.1 2-amino-4-hydroxy-6-hydroxymethyldihydropteridine diphosphokinase [Saprospira sp. CCB-QB6]
MALALLALGSNMGIARNYLQFALDELAKIGQITSQSDVYLTAAWGLEDQADFENMALALQCELSPEELLKACLSIEAKAGRIRKQKWGPRCLDIDIIFYNQEQINLPQLQIPHPQLHKRRFVLAPLAQIAPQFIHPSLNQSIQDLLDHCQDPLPVQKIASQN